MTIQLENLQSDDEDYRFDLTLEVDSGTHETVEDGGRPEYAGRPYIRLDADDGSGEYLCAMIWDEPSADELLSKVQGAVEDFKRRLKKVETKRELHSAETKEAHAPEKD